MKTLRFFYVMSFQHYGAEYNILLILKKPVVIFIKQDEISIKTVNRTVLIQSLIHLYQMN